MSTLITYRNASDDLKLNKNLTLINTYEVNPVFNHLGGNDFEIIVEKEYFDNGVNYIQLDGKFYFVRNGNNIEGGLVVKRLHVDVLMTYRNRINNTTGIVARSGTQGNNYLVDEKLKTLVKHDYDVYKFPHMFSSQVEYLLTCSG